METIKWEDWFVYDETSPSGLRWIVDRVSGRNGNQVHVRAGDVAGSPSSSGYYQVKLNNKLWLCHRLVVTLQGVSLAVNDFVDHIDGNKLNNYRENLRVVARCTNARNAKMRLDNSSGVTGVTRISNGQGSFYWSARCENGDGTFCQKRYAIRQYGDEGAFKLACIWRKEKIKALNSAGAGYTERHGVDK